MKSPRSILTLVWLTCLLALPAFAVDRNISDVKRPKQTDGMAAVKALADRHLKSLFIGTDTHQCNHSDPISCGTPVTGTLSTADCALQDGTYIDDWSFNGTSGQQLTINLSSSTMDTYLFLVNPAGTAVAQDDDGGGGTNSRITFTLNAAGTWHIVANTYSPETGNYNLSVTCTQGTPCTLNSSPIACNTTQNGTLSSTDCTLGDNSHYDEWTFSGTTGQQVTITQRSSAFDSYLILVNPSGASAAEDDDSGGGLDSRITFTLNATGTWKIIANSFDPAVTGAYTIQLQCGTTGTGCTTGGTQLCLNSNRFRVTVNWRDFSGNTGSGNAVALTNDTGYFWFFNAANVELVVKVLDARAVNNRFWVYYGALTNVEYTMTVTDTQTGAVRTYNNPSGTFASAGDVNAFAP